MNIRINLLFLLLFLVVATAKSQDLLGDGATLKLTQQSKNKKYAYTDKQPVKLGGIPQGGRKAEAYLSALKGPKGEPIKYRKLVSCCQFKTDKALIGTQGELDRYAINYEGLSEPIVLYINEYDYEKPVCPKGLTYKKADEVQTIKRMDAARIKKVTVCKKDKLYAVDDFLLRDDLEYEDEELLPSVAPKPKKADAVTNYFADKALSDSRAQGIMCRVQISFLVNCKGEAGNYFITTEGKGDVEELSNQILEIVNEMNVEWNPAQKDGKAVDCYQVLTFALMGGNLNRVSIEE